jgi:membrane associated rhomboid family serine protease
MFFIYSDNLRHGKIQVGVVLLISLQIIFFCLSGIYENLSFGENYPLQFVPMLFSLKPAVYSYTLVTATFLHIGFWHLFGNVMFFLAFARTLERLFGTLVFLSAYVFIGALAYIGDWLLHPNSGTPIVGSSGAVSFLMGVYLMLFPKAKLRLIITIPPFFKRFWISAYIFLLLWIALQGYDIFTDDGQGEVAYATHIFGFVVGVIAAMSWKEMAPDTDRKLSELMEDTQ